MSFSGCYGEVMDIVDSASKRFGGLYLLNDERTSSLKDVCDSLDNMIEEFDCEYIDINVDEVTMQLSVKLVMFDMILEYGKSHEFFDLITKVDSFGFSKSDDNISVGFNIDGLWRKTSG